MGNTDSVVAQKRLARFRPDERPVIEGTFDRLHGAGSSASSGKTGKVLSLDLLKMTMGKMASESMIKRVFHGIHSIDPEVPLPPGDGISCEQLVIFLADILRGTAEERAPLVLAMAEGAKATATTQCKGMGGQHGYFGLWLDCDFGNGHSRARPRCTTYGSPQLSGDEDFKLDTVEVWGVGQPPEEQEQDEKKKSILDADPEVQAMMEMAGKTLHSQGLREHVNSEWLDPV